MNTLIAVILGALTVYLTYTRYARRIDRNVIQSDPQARDAGHALHGRRRFHAD
ncbi:MAG TPA: hypothetical protein VI585_18935 [Candidatus Binatia bacterium]